MSSFLRRKPGAASDLRELMFVSALQQTQQKRRGRDEKEEDGKFRRDGSIRDVDIQLFLRSRYGIETTLEEIRETIMMTPTTSAGYGGGGGSNKDKDDDDGAHCNYYMDFLEMVSTILIPTMLKAAADDVASRQRGTNKRRGSSILLDFKKKNKKYDNDEEGDDNENCEEWFRESASRHHNNNNLEQRLLYPDPKLLEKVLSLLLVGAGVTGITSENDDEESFSAPELNEELLQDILRSIGEVDMANDDELIRDMVDYARTQCSNQSTVAVSSSAATAVAEEEDTSTAAANGNNNSLSDERGGHTTTTNTTAPFVHLDAKTFAKLLTADISTVYDIYDEARSTTTNYQDVVLSVLPHDNNNSEKSSRPDGVGDTRYRKFFSSSAIDYTSSRYDSKLIVVMLWVLFIMSAVDWFFVGQPPFNVDLPECNGDFGCLLWTQIVSWLVKFNGIWIQGFLVIGLGSLGNGIDVRSSRKWLLLLAAVFTFFGGFTVNSDPVSEDQNNNVDNGDASTDDTQADTIYLGLVVFIFAVLVVVAQISLFSSTCAARGGQCCCAKDSCQESKCCRVFSLGGAKTEATMKRAAAYKINQIVENALKLHEDKGMLMNTSHDVNATTSESAILRFSRAEDEFEEVGGFAWGWKRFWSGELYYKDGVRFSARILAANVSQFVVAGFLLVFGIRLTLYLVGEWDKYKDDPASLVIVIIDSVFSINFREDVVNTTSSGYCSTILNQDLARFNVSLPFNDTLTCLDTTTTVIVGAMNSTASQLYPEERYMVQAPLATAVIVAFVTSLGLFTLYVPSVVSTTLKLRGGKIPFYEDPVSWEDYRKRMDFVTFLMGSMFWSSVFSPIMMAVIFGLLLFLILWQATQAFMLQLVAILVGILVCVFIKSLASVYLISNVYSGFYRWKVNRVNFVSLAIECSMIGIGIVSVAGRAFLIMLISIFYIGRIDTPLFAPSVALGSIKDQHPLLFVKEILLQEAHRHPYIEVLGKIYLLRLCHGDKFKNRSSRVGHGYRLMFTSALMPWLRKYRFMARNASVASQPDPAFTSDRKKGLEQSMVFSAELIDI